MAAAPKLMTVNEYFRTPESVQPSELAFGVLRAADAPRPRHQSAVLSFCRVLDRHVRDRRIGRIWLAPLDVILDEKKALVIQPDLMFISNERDWIVEDRVRGAPDLVIEVLSPQPRVGRTDERLRWFAEYNVRECWLVQLNRRDVTVVSFADKKAGRRKLFRSTELIRSTVLPEFHHALDELLDEEP